MPACLGRLLPGCDTWKTVAMLCLHSSVAHHICFDIQILYTIKEQALQYALSMCKH